MSKNKGERLPIYDMEKDDIFDPFGEELFVPFDKGSEKESMFKDIQKTKYMFSLRGLAIETATERGWLGLLKEWEPDKIHLMDCKIRDAEAAIFRKAFYIVIIVMVLSWFFGYEMCRQQAVSFFEPASLEYYCKKNDSVYFSREMSKAIKKYLAPF